MSLRLVRFVGLLLAALVQGLSFCHVAEMPGKLRLTAMAWLTVQHTLYGAFGPPLGAPLELGAIALAWVAAYLVARDEGTGGRAFAWTLAGAAALTAALLAWFLVVSPVNVRIAAWVPDTLPRDWTAYRDRWEAGHALHFALVALGFASLLWAAVGAAAPSRSRPEAPRHDGAGLPMR